MLDIDADIDMHGSMHTDVKINRIRVCIHKQNILEYIHTYTHVCIGIYAYIYVCNERYRYMYRYKYGDIYSYMYMNMRGCMFI